MVGHGLGLRGDGEQERCDEGGERGSHVVASHGTDRSVK
jgi:hypothetical protein